MKKMAILFGAAGMLFGNTLLAQQQSLAVSLGLFVYPSGGQSLERQTIDEQECYAWAQQTTGVNPNAPPGSQAPASAPQEDTAQAGAREGMRSAARNVLIANATDNDWEDAAAIGLVFGSSRGARQARQRNAQAQQQAQQQQQQTVEQQMGRFRNAFSACIEGRGYTIR